MVLAKGVAGGAVPAGQTSPGEAGQTAGRRLAAGEQTGVHHQAGGKDRPSRRFGVATDVPAATAFGDSSAPSLLTLPGSGIRISPISQPSTVQMTSRSSSLMLAGLP